ncbi:MAG TPA: CCA tRNA nucleotidyltransferase [Patescibacteria group bacterium]|nr:CCA tRNA nucleotidyltransferase [Patescibacteria group bacterium]
MKVDVPGQVAKIISAFEKKDFEIYIVGGAIRDILMGKIVYDWDFTTNAVPEQILTLFENAYYDNKFGTVGIPNEIEGERPYEITTFRTEHGYSDSRRPDKVLWGKTLTDDLKRRDFTINAMALKIEQESKRVKEYKKKTAQALALSRTFTLIDLYDGQKDLENKLIRAVGNPVERFTEDSLRMMRAVRIATEIRFQIEEHTLFAIKELSDSIRKITAERVRDELLKIMKSPYAHEGVMLLQKTKLMEQIIPEFEKAFDIQQKSPRRHHVYDVGTHSLMSLKFAPTEDPVTKLAILIHDLGKVSTYKKLNSGIITFYNHEVVSTYIAKKLAKRIKLSKKQSEKLEKLVRWHQFSVNENQTDTAVRRFITNVGLENVSDMLALRTADRLGGGASETSWRLEDFKRKIKLVQKQPFKVTDLKINGVTVMKKLNLKPGPKVGEALKKLFDLVVAKEIKNNPDELIEALLKLK